jgi:hypothetical protein
MPGVPNVELDPDLVLLIVLPPLLFNAAYFASLGELRAHARTISINAFGLALATMAAVPARCLDAEAGHSRPRALSLLLASAGGGRTDAARHEQAGATHRHASY